MAHGGRINILVVDDQSGKSYQWTISALRLRILLSAAGVLCILALSAIVLAGLVIEQNNRLDELTAENMRLTVYAMEISQLRDELNHHRNFTRQLCGLLGIEIADSGTMASTGIPPSLIAEMTADSAEMVSLRTDPLISAVATAPLPSELLPNPENRPAGIPMRGRPSRGFASDQENVSLRHFGLDIAGREGSPVFATAAGVVTFAGWDAALGNLIIIDHGNGCETVYGHNSAMMFEKGDHVDFGQIIALSGNSGISSAPHLHYEIRYNSRPVDPVQFVYPDSTSIPLERTEP